MSSSADFHFSPRPNRASEIGWRPWSEVAFAEAVRLDRPILLSISAVWCHWCHVMDETTYSDPGVIELIRREYVPIRVDRDVRPDVDHRYNLGGWPTTAFLTPQGDILTGGTYIPPEEMSGAAVRVAEHYRGHKAEIGSRAQEGRDRAAKRMIASSGELDPGLVVEVLEAADRLYDPEFGGFGTEPKFPHPDALAFLAEQATVRGESRLLGMVRKSLHAMAGGGMYDHVEGGFFRYSTTRDWRVPHFEKMLEDHAGLIEALALSGQVEILDSTIGYLDRVLFDPQARLYAGSQDADEDYYSHDSAGRSQLTPPYVDRRIYVAWNAALAVGFMLAGSRLGRSDLRQRGLSMVDALLAGHRSPDGAMTHTSGVVGDLSDQAWTLLAATRAGRDAEARALVAVLERDHLEPDARGYLDHAGRDLLGRLAEPLMPMRENAVAAIALHELGETKLARRTLAAVAGQAGTAGIQAATFARALDRVERPAIRVTTGNTELARIALTVAPYAVHEASADDRVVLCFGTLCLAPLASAEEMIRALSEPPPTVLTIA